MIKKKILKNKKRSYVEKRTVVLNFSTFFVRYKYCAHELTLKKVSNVYI